MPSPQKMTWAFGQIHLIPFQFCTILAIPLVPHITLPHISIMLAHSDALSFLTYHTMTIISSLFF